MINKTLAHIALFGGPAAGEIRRLHPEGHDADAAADEGATRTAHAFRADLAAALDGLETAWLSLGEEQWDHGAIMTAGPRTLAETVSHHLRNVEVHHVDLDVGYGPRDWPPEFLEGELAKRLRGLPERADHAELLAWLLDRAPAPPLGPW